MKSLVGVLIGVAIVACSNASDGPVATVPPMTGICVGGPTVTPTVSTLHVGDTLRVSVAACYIASTPWRWRVSDTLVASVDSVAGLIRARAAGQATVIARYVADTTVKGAGIVVVTP